MDKKIFVTVLFLFLLHVNTVFSYQQDELSIHGFASTGYLKSNHNNYLVSSKEGSFEFNEFGINFSTSITDNIRTGMQLYSFDLGEIGNNQVKLDWAFLDCQWKETLGIRLGKIKGPIGFYNEVRDYDMLRTSVLMPQCIYNNSWRESLIGIQGASIYGKISLGKVGRLDYNVYGGTNTIESDGGLAKVMVQGEDESFSATMNYLSGGRIIWKTPVEDLSLAGTVLAFDLFFKHSVVLESLIPDGQINIYSMEYTIGNLTAAAEYYVMKLDRTTILASTGEKADASRTYPEGMYGQITYQFSDWIESGTYYSVYYADNHDRSGRSWGNDYEAWQKDWAINISFDILDNWIVKVEVHFMDGVALTYSPSQNDHQEWTLYTIKTTFNF